MATLLIQQPDGLFCIFNEGAATFSARDMTQPDAAGKVKEMLGWKDWATTPVGAIDHLLGMFRRAEADKGQWPAARRRVCQVHGPDAAAWMLTVERKAAVHAFNHATPEQIEAAISTLSPEGQAWARDFEARGKR